MTDRPKLKVPDEHIPPALQNDSYWDGFFVITVLLAGLIVLIVFIIAAINTLAHLPTTTCETALLLETDAIKIIVERCGGG